MKNVEKFKGRQLQKGYDTISCKKNILVNGPFGILKSCKQEVFWVFVVV